MTGSRQSPAVLERVAFKVSRLVEFCSKTELTKQIGHDSDEWPLVILKELIDNALDAAEEKEIAPEIEIMVSTDTGEIIIADNGPGLPFETIKGVLDYTVRVSSREAYVSPSRGQQGNALKTILAMAYALDGERGETQIETGGHAYRIVFQTDRVRREPRVNLSDAGLSDVQIGTRITVRWPEKAMRCAECCKGPIFTNCRRLHDVQSAPDAAMLLE
ncbi:MAG: ATP-binding protein [Acidobacteria bacterium]|nr:ATP-binding protein [Acidobacteriota bacterium]MBV9481631.1 ATP-binding protein [Acidobacteriota bacterium]